VEARLIRPVIEANFLPGSHGCRPKRKRRSVTAVCGASSYSLHRYVCAAPI